MSYEAKVYNVMIASPGDLEEERKVCREVIYDWNAVNSETKKIVLMPTGWETHSSPEMGGTAQGIINDQVLSPSDVLVGIFWTRAGTPTAEHESGTIEEIERHIAAGRLAMIYFSDREVRLSTVNPEQYAKVNAFRESCKSRGLLNNFETVNDFREKFSRHLQIKVNTHKIFSGLNSMPESVLPEIEAPLSIAQSLTREARFILKEVCLDEFEQVSYVCYFGGADLETNNKNLLEGIDSSAMTKWEVGFHQLETKGLISDVVSTGEVFKLTTKGREVASLLK
ncbi:DUF4062 domain-containing protein [Pseudomonas helleri]|uniref:DUF4062 domain-containing protein n=1 Tax=Pseudomonas helleri TaxID=1608996 RepID=UPI003FD23761